MLVMSSSFFLHFIFRIFLGFFFEICVTDCFVIFPAFLVIFIFVIFMFRDFGCHVFFCLHAICFHHFCLFFFAREFSFVCYFL